MLDKVTVVCIDKDAPTLEAIEGGRYLCNRHRQAVHRGLLRNQIPYDYNHNKLKLVSDSKAAGISPLPTFVDTGSIVITKDNVSLL